MEIIKAKKWFGRATRQGREVRFYIETQDENGQKHEYGYFVTGNNWNAAGTWSSDFQNEGKPSAEIIKALVNLTENWSRSYYKPAPCANPLADDDENNVVEQVSPRYSHDEENMVTW